MNELASCSPHVIHCNSTTLSSKQQSTLQTTSRRGVQFKLDFDLHKLIEPLKIMLPDLFTNDLYIADSLTRHTALLHKDDITSDDVTGTVGEVPIGDKKSDTAHDDVMLNGMGESPLINDDQHDHTSQGELTGDNNKGTLDDVKESLTDNDFPVISTDPQQDTTVI